MIHNDSIIKNTNNLNIYVSTIHYDPLISELSTIIIQILFSKHQTAINTGDIKDYPCLPDNSLIYI